jgi:hypothetical protein
MENLPVLAGSLSSLIFTLGTLDMLRKAWRTKDVRSYSVYQLLLNNIGNGVHWLYISSLPFGPIWLLHSFYTVSTLLMLTWWLLYRYAPEATTKRTTQTLKRISQTVHRITETTEFPKVGLKGESSLL